MLWWLIFLYSLVRLPLLLWPIQMAGNDDYFVMGELTRGAIAVEFLEGPRLEFLEYVDNIYGMGDLFIGLWTVPFFALLGKTLFALKLVPLLWQLSSFIAWFFLFRRHFSVLETFFISLFFVLPPPQITTYTLFNIGYHFDTIFWIAISLLIFRCWLEEKWTEVSAGCLLGLLGGFASALILSHCLFVLALWVYLGLMKGTHIRKWRFYVVYGLCFLIGFTPWLFLSNHIGWHHFTGWFTSFARSPLYDFSIFENTYRFLRYPLRNFFAFHLFSFWPRHFFTEGYATLFLVSFFYLLWKKAKDVSRGVRGFDIEAFGLLLQILFISFVILFDHYNATHYLFPIVPFIGMNLVILARALNRVLRLAMASFCILAGILGNFASISFGSFGATLAWPGYSYAELASCLSDGAITDSNLLFQKFKALAKGQSHAIQQFLYRRLPYEYLEIKTAKDLSRFLVVIQGEPEPVRPILFEKLGVELGIYSGFQHETLSRLLKEEHVPEKFYPEIYQGALQGHFDGIFFKEFLSQLKKGASFCQSAPLNIQPECFKTLGYELALESEKAQSYFSQIHPLVPKGQATSLLHGMGEAFVVGELWRLNPKFTRSFYQSVQMNERQWFLSGLRAGIKKEESPYLQKMYERGLSKVIGF